MGDMCCWSPSKDDHDVVLPMYEVCITIYRCYNGEHNLQCCQMNDSSQHHHEGTLLGHLKWFCDQLHHRDNQASHPPIQQSAMGSSSATQAGPSTARQWVPACPTGCKQDPHWPQRGPPTNQWSSKQDPWHPINRSHHIWWPQLVHQLLLLP